MKLLNAKNLYAEIIVETFVINEIIMAIMCGTLIPVGTKKKKKFKQF